MIAHFHGTRGSTPAAVARNETSVADSSYFGNSTTCLEVEVPGRSERFIIDAGSGIQKINPGKGPSEYHIFLSHLHWDHIQGFPFFRPIYEAGNSITLHGYHMNLEYAIGTQMSEPFFPIALDNLPSSIEFDIRTPDESFKFGNLEISALALNHPGVSYAYRFDFEGKSITFASDVEHPEGISLDEYDLVKFAENSDLLILDGMYSPEEASSSKRNHGHSSYLSAVEVGKMAKANHVVVTHHPPTKSTPDLLKAEKEAQKHAENTEITVNFAYDGLSIET